MFQWIQTEEWNPRPHWEGFETAWDGSIVKVMGIGGGSEMKGCFLAAKNKRKEDWEGNKLEWSQRQHSVCPFCRSLMVRKKIMPSYKIWWGPLSGVLERQFCETGILWCATGNETYQGQRADPSFLSVRMVHCAKGQIAVLHHDCH